LPASIDSVITESYTTVSSPIVFWDGFTKGRKYATLPIVNPTDYRSILFKNPKIKGVIEQESERVTSIPLETSHGGGEDCMLDPLCSVCSIISHLVNAGERIFTWKMRSHHEFMPLLVEEED